MSPRLPGHPALAAAVLSLTLTGWSTATPYVPGRDSDVLATVPARATDASAQELARLRAAWRADPRDAGRAVQLARHYFDRVAAEGDPRYVGYAQATLQPWWGIADAPAEVRVLRAMVLQFEHRFAEALADLDAAVRADPGLGVAWSWRTAILMVQADYTGARTSCSRMAALTTPLVAAACRAQVDAVTGQAERAARELRAALQQAPTADPQERLWSLTRLAETEERLGNDPAAEAAYREAGALGLADVYLLAAHADFLLDRGRAAEVLTLLRGSGRADVLLLRLALAARATGDPAATGHAAEMAARFAAAALRGDTSHEKEESRFALGIQGDVPKALALAQRNWSVQKEPADARILLQAALAARNAAAAAPVLRWMAASGIESAVLRSLSDRLKALR